YIILVAAVISLLAGERADFGIIMAVVLIDAVLGFIQEYQAQRTYTALKNLLSKGMISFEEKVENGRNKKVYSITDVGRQAFYQWMKSLVPVEVSCKKERRFYLVFLQCCRNQFSAVSKFVARKYQCYFFFCWFAPYYSAFVKNICIIICSFFFCSQLSSQMSQVLLYPGYLFHRINIFHIFFQIQPVINIQSLPIFFSKPSLTMVIVLPTSSIS
ncbi:MAG: hypothetical protein HGA25_05235, partial [Clostridiales bacterium]|nr:hypothetical protein [Clostridiales bacterium]